MSEPAADQQLGALPTAWSIKRLGSLGDLVKGRGGSKEDNRDVGVPVVRYGDLYTRFAITIAEPSAFVSEEDAANYTPLPTNSLIFAASGESAEDIGKSALSLLAEPAVVGGDTVLLHPSSEIHPLYLAYALESAPIRSYKAIRATGFTVVHISAGKLKTIPIPHPPLEEQRAIADYLDRETARIDTLIKEQQHLIELLRERRAALIANQTGSGATDSTHWPMMRLSWLFQKTGSGTTPANEDITYGEDADVPWVTTGELRESVITGTARGVSFDVLGRYSALKAHPAGSLLIAMYGATIGRMALLGVDATSNQACCALVEPTRSDPKFVQYSLMSAKSRLLLEAAGGGQPNINQDKIRSFRIPTPSLEDQRKVTAYLDAQTAKVDTLIAEAERFIDLSEERRSALITAAVTGKLDVRDAS